jgi:hypothetical protein
MSAIFSVVNFECPAFYCSAAEKNTLSRACARIFKMAWYGNVRFKQRAITEFLVTEKELVTHIRKRLKSLYGVNAVDKSTISLWVSRIAGFRERPSGTH